MIKIIRVDWNKEKNEEINSVVFEFDKELEEDNLNKILEMSYGRCRFYEVGGVVYPFLLVHRDD